MAYRVLYNAHSFVYMVIYDLEIQLSSLVFFSVFDFFGWFLVIKINRLCNFI